MTRSRATRLGRAGILLPMLLARACAAVPDLGAKPMPTRRAIMPRRSRLRRRSRHGRPTAGGRLQRSAARPADRRGLAGSPDLAAAAARFRTAQGLAQQAGAELLPTLDAARSVDHQKQSQNHAACRAIPNGWNATATRRSASTSTSTCGARTAPPSRREEGRRGGRFEAEEARLLLTTGIASTYADLAALYAQRDSLEPRSTSARRRSRLVKQRVDAGSTTIARSARPKRASRRPGRPRRDRRSDHARQACARRAGRAGSRPRAHDRAAGAQHAPGTGPSRRTRRSTSSAAAPTSPPRAMRVEAAAERIKEARAAFYPNITFRRSGRLVSRSGSAACSAAAPASQASAPADQPAALPRRRAPGPVPRSPRSV